MKPIFGVDITENKKNERVCGAIFAARTVSPDAGKRLETSVDKLEDVNQKAKLPLPVRILHYIFAFAAVILTVGILRGTLKVGFAEGYANAPALFWLDGAAIVGVVICEILARVKKKEVREATGADEIEATVIDEQENVLQDLNVPPSAPCVDVLVFRFKNKNGEIKPYEGFSPSAYTALEMRMFKENGCLCLADLENVYAFPISELRGIREVGKRISVMGWNKPEDPRSSQYKKYKLTVNNVGCVFSKPYYILELERDGELYGIYFPCYELGMFEKATGLSAEAKKD